MYLYIIINQKLMKKSLYLLIMLSVTLCSCVKPDNIKVTNFGGVSIGGVTPYGIDGNIKIFTQNDGRPVTIKDMEVSLFTQQSPTPFLTLISLESVIIPKGVNTEIIIPLNMKVKGGLLGSLVLKSIIEKNISNITVSINGHVKSGLISTNVNIEKMPISQIMNKIGIEDVNIKKLF